MYISRLASLSSLSFSDNLIRQILETNKQLQCDKFDKLALKCIHMEFLAHLSRRLIGELIGNPCSGVRHGRRRSCQQFQTSSPWKPLDQLMPNFMWSLLGKGERKFV